MFNIRIPILSLLRENEKEIQFLKNEINALNDDRARLVRFSEFDKGEYEKKIKELEHDLSYIINDDDKYFHTSGSTIAALRDRVAILLKENEQLTTYVTMSKERTLENWKMIRRKHE
jgi:hypothetical protein